MKPTKGYAALAIALNAGREKKGSSVENSQPTSDPVSPLSRDRLLQVATAHGCLGWSARCVNGIYLTTGTLCQSGALAGVALLTIADLSDWQKSVAGGLTVGLIGLSTFCFWKLSFCPEKNQVMVPVSSYSGLQTLSLSNRRLISDPDNTDAESEPDKIPDLIKVVPAKTPR